MTDYKHFFEPFLRSPLAHWAAELAPAIEAGMSSKRWGDLPAWLRAYNTLPAIAASDWTLTDAVRIGRAEDADHDQRHALDAALRALKPWRKGPFTLFGIELDTEWRSDWKWQRVLPHLSPLTDRTVLDVGCGNGYHCLRMLGAGARRVVGVDPSPRFVVQFYSIKKYLGEPPVDVLPLGIEALPANRPLFDTTFSMGVLYHRRSPMDHLRELKDTLVPGGELVLETLVIDGGLGQVLVPEGRYAMMGNVWFLPSCPTLMSWMTKCGYRDVQLVDVSQTSTLEQRATEWMDFYSLADFLHPDDPDRTVEGHPAPRRAVIVARKPG